MFHTSVSVLAFLHFTQGTWEFDYLSKLSEGFFATEELASEAESYQEKWVGFAALFQLIIVVQFILLCLWIYRMNKSTRALNPAISMRFTPGWSVGWIFIPIANVWKPYQVLKELWAANHTPQLANSGKVSYKLIGVFWFMYLISLGLGKLVFKQNLTAEDLPDLIFANKITLLSDTVDIPYYILTILLAHQIYTLHKNLYASRSHSSLKTD